MNLPVLPAASEALNDSPDAQQDDLPTRLSALVRTAAQGNARAFEEFYELTVRIAFVGVLRLVGHNHVEDVLSEAYLQAWQQCSKFDPRRANAIAWLMTIARSRALDRLRAERLCHAGANGAPLSLDDDVTPSSTPGPPALLEASRMRTRLNAALAALSTSERWVLGLAYYQEMSHSQIATATTLPLGTVKSILRRCPLKMRETLQNPCVTAVQPTLACSLILR